MEAEYGEIKPQEEQKKEMSEEQAMGHSKQTPNRCVSAAGLNRKALGQIKMASTSLQTMPMGNASVACQVEYGQVQKNLIP